MKRHASPKRNAALFVLVVGALATVPLWAGPYYVDIGIATLFYISLSLAWNIMSGMTGQLSLGHNLFTAAGALVANAFHLHFGINIWLAILVSMVVAALLGVVITWLAFRFRLAHLAFALVTLAFGEMGLLIVLETEFLGAASGLFLAQEKPGILALRFASTSSFYWPMLLVAVAIFLVSAAILNSKLGYYVRAIRDNEDAAQSMGIDVLRTRMIAMIISAAGTALSAAVYSQYQMYVDPYFYASPVLVIEIVLFTTIGGLGTLWGPILGAGLLVPLGSILRSQFGDVAPGLHYVIYGALIVVVILVMPSGLVRGLRPLWRRMGRAQRTPKVVLAARMHASGEGGQKM